MGRLRKWVVLAIVGALAACAGPPKVQSPANDPRDGRAGATARPSGGVIVQPKSRWIAVDWSVLPGFDDDSLHEGWSAWLRTCEKPPPAFLQLCSEVRSLSIADGSAQRAWMRQKLQPYRVETHQGDSQGMLTGYFEPAMEASRNPTPEFNVPLWRVPLTLGKRKPWYSRQEIDFQPDAKLALRDRAIVFLADPIDAQILQIQGSGRLRVREPDGSSRWVRLAYAGSNDHPYRSLGRWLLDQGLVRDASWQGIKNWVRQNPSRLQELVRVNPRVVFFQEGADDLEFGLGPKGAQGVALTAGRSIAVDSASIPFGTPVWLSSAGSQFVFQKMVLAQDTGNAISGAVRADYFVGFGDAAGESAGRLRQALQMWVLWPK